MQQLAPSPSQRSHSLVVYFRAVLGRYAAERKNLVAIYSARLDETGTDGRSEYMLIGGAVATAEQWDSLEKSWGRLLSRNKAAAYHWKDFNDPNNEIFGQWSRLKRQRFVASQEKIIQRNTMFRVSVGIDRKTHSSV